MIEKKTLGPVCLRVSSYTWLVKYTHTHTQYTKPYTEIILIFLLIIMPLGCTYIHTHFHLLTFSLLLTACFLFSILPLHIAAAAAHVYELAQNFAPDDYDGINRAKECA